MTIQDRESKPRYRYHTLGASWMHDAQSGSTYKPTEKERNIHTNLLHRRKQCQNNGLLHGYENITLTPAEMAYSFKMYTRFKGKEDIEDNIRHINEHDSKKLREMIRKIREQSFPVLMTNNKVGNLSNRFTSQGRIFGKFMEFMLQNKDPLKNISKSLIHDIVNLILAYTSETLSPSSIKYNIDEQVVKISQIPFQTNIIEEVRKIMKILLYYKYVSYVDIECQDYSNEIRFKFGNVTFWEEMFDWKIGECPIPSCYIRDYAQDVIKDEAEINNILNWIKQGYGLGYGDKSNDYHRSYVTCSIVPYLLLDKEYDVNHGERAYNLIRKITETLKENPQEETLLDTHLTYGINVQVHTSQNVKTVDSKYGYVGIYNHYRSIFENHTNKNIFKDMQSMEDRYHARLHHLNWAIDRLQDIKADTEDHPDYDMLKTNIDWSDINMEGYEDEQYYQYGFYDKQIAYKEAEKVKLEKLYRRSKQSYSPIQTREFMLKPGEIHNTGNANGQQMIGVVLCKQMHHVIDVVSPVPIVSIETKNMEDIPSVNLATMSLNYKGKISPYIRQCYDLCHSYKTWVNVVATCHAMHKISAIREYNERIDPNIITNKILKSNIYKDFINICDIGDYVSGFDKNCYHLPYNHINGYMITVTHDVSRSRFKIPKPQCYLIFNLEHQEVEVVNLYATIGIPSVSMSTLLMVILNKNVSDPNVVKAFGKQDKYSDSDNATIEEPPRKKRKIESQTASSRDRWIEEHKQQEGKLSKTIINKLNCKTSSISINNLFSNHFNQKDKSEQEKQQEYINKIWKISIIKKDDVTRFRNGFDEDMIGGRIIKIDYNHIKSIAENIYKSLKESASVETYTSKDGDGGISETSTTAQPASVGNIGPDSKLGIGILSGKGFRDGDFSTINDEIITSDGIHVVKNPVYADMTAREEEVKLIENMSKNRVSTILKSSNKKEEKSGQDIVSIDTNSNDNVSRAKLANGQSSNTKVKGSQTNNMDNQGSHIKANGLKRSRSSMHEAESDNEDNASIDMDTDTSSVRGNPVRSQLRDPNNEEPDRKRQKIS